MSDCRSASASTALRASRSRSIATASSDASAGNRRLRAARFGSPPSTSSSVPTRLPPARSSIGEAFGACGRSPSSTIDADGAWSTAATRSPIQSIRPATSPPCSSEVAISASSAVSASRCSASVARRRARAASSLTTTAVNTYTASANQLRESSSVNVCTGERKKKLNSSMPPIDTAIA